MPDVGAFEALKPFFNDNDDDDSVMDAVNNLLSECDEPGRRSMIGSCQECVCSENLQIKCSITENCKNGDNIYKKKVDDKVKNENKKPIGNQKCVPYSNFRDECNSCSCSDDGMHVACTKRYCRPGQFNKDGTIYKNLSEIIDSQLAFDLEDDKDDFDIISADKPYLKPIKNDKVEYSVIDKMNTFSKLDDNLVKIEPFGGDRVEKNWKQLEKHLPQAETTTEQPKNIHDELRKK